MNYAAVDRGGEVEEVEVPDGGGPTLRLNRYRRAMLLNLSGKWFN